MPKQYLSAILGSSNSVLHNIERKTGTHISVDKISVKSPYILCYINGNEMEGIRLAESMIKNILDSESEIETREMFVPIEDSKHFEKLYISRATVREIEKYTEARLTVENDIYKTEGVCYFNIFFCNLFSHVWFFFLIMLHNFFSFFGLFTL